MISVQWYKVNVTVALCTPRGVKSPGFVFIACSQEDCYKWGPIPKDPSGILYFESFRTQVPKVSWTNFKTYRSYWKQSSLNGKAWAKIRCLAKALNHKARLVRYYFSVFVAPKLRPLIYVYFFYSGVTQKYVCIKHNVSTNFVHLLRTQKVTFC